MIIKTNSNNRKEIFKAIREFTGKEQYYLGPPSFSYLVGSFTVDRDGLITCAIEKEAERLREYLVQQGYVEEQPRNLEISVSAESMDGSSLCNLVFMLRSKQYMLNRVVGGHYFNVTEELIGILEAVSPKTKEDFLNIYMEHKEAIRGVTIDDNKITFTFPISEKPDKNRAYAEVAALMVSRSKGVKKVNAKQQIPENEKYYFRVWLIALGLGGRGGKASRKVLLEGLKGHTAFRTLVDEVNHKARMYAKKQLLNKEIESNTSIVKKSSEICSNQDK
ncbi:hypothetical protein [Clostridium polynesiense]|uniref:hypothetical protein n=1 Tax=Clostridium polynesiense TaxID=1325933 RepID=UPI000A5EA83B|nr:hypothetical protein [Clostridium polynesiense]